jgi:hypothetical protein
LRQDGATKSATIGQALDSDLASLNSAWVALPPALKAGIMAMVKAATKVGRN